MFPSLSKSRLRWVTAVALTGAAVLAGSVVTGQAATAQTTGNLIANGSFTSSLTGWEVSTGSPSLARIAPTNYAAVKNTTAAATTVNLNDRVNTVAATVAGTKYTAKVRVRSTSVVKLDLRMQEWGTTKTAEAKTAVQAGASWTEASVDLVAVRSGDSIDLNLVGYAVPAGGGFDVELMSLKNAAGAEFLADPSFSGGVGAWFIPKNGSVALASNDHDAVNGPFARMTNPAASAQTVVVRGETDAPVTSVVGTDYHAMAKLRSNALAGQTVKVGLSEGSAPAEYGDVTFDSAGWATATVETTASTTGAPIGVTVVAPNLPAGKSVDFDDVSLVAIPDVPPTASFTATSDGLNLAVDGSASSDPDGSVASYAWDFGDGSTAVGAAASRSYAAAGTYTVRLTVKDDKGVSATTTKSVVVTKPNVAPTAAFASTSADLKVTVDGSASSDPDGSVASYAWDFGDGSTAVGATASRTYAAAGTYTVRLTVKDDKGASGTSAKSVVVTKPNAAPTAAFAATTANLQVSVDAAAATDPDGSIASYRWDFGDGTTANGATATRTYTAAGSYVVTLTVTDDKGATGTSTKNVAVAVPASDVVFADEFDGSAVNTGNWKALFSNYGSGGGQLQCHTPNNPTVSNGTLKITAKKETVTCPGNLVRQYSSGFLSSRDAGRYYPLYGRYEIRARIPHGQGIGAAFWLRHRGGAGEAEVDIMETFHAQAPGTVTQTLHFPNSIGAHAAKKGTFIESPVKGSGGWHTYAVDIRQAVPGSDAQVRFRFYVDGVLTKDWTNTNASSWTSVDKQQAWDIAVSVPVGGAYWGNPAADLGFLSSGMIGGSNPNKCSLTYKTPTNGPASCPTDKNSDGVADIWLAQFPATYEVDWVRVTK